MSIPMRILMAFLLAATASAAPADDARSVAIYRGGLQAIVDHLDRHAPAGDRLLSADERESVRIVWKSFLDYQLGLETVRASHASFARRRGAERDRSFRINHAAFLAQYRTALDFISRCEKTPSMHTVLNEPVPELGIARGGYADFKLRWLNVARAAELSAFSLVSATVDDPLPELRAAAREDEKAIYAAGAGDGTKQTLRNARKVVKTALWKPVPAGIAVVASGPAGPPPRQPFVSIPQLQALRARMQPGDILFERREWALTNVGLPGFWPHVALYVGTPDERRRAFGDAFEESLRTRYPAAYAKHLAHPGMIEALGEGVIANTFEHSARADFVAVVRPRLPNERKAQAIERAFAFVGRPYDFNFDFFTDDAIVCTELVFKAYEPELALPVLEMTGRRVTPANDYVRWFDEQYDRPDRPLEFVGFLDGQQRKRTAVESDLAGFRASWQRPRWHSLASR